MNNNRERRSNNGLLFIAGAIAGAALTYYANTPKGKQLTNDILTKGKEISSTVSNKASEISTTVTEKANEIKDTVSDKSKEFASVASDTLQIAKNKLASNTVEALDIAESKIGDFQKGINKAKTSIQNGTTNS